jgi:deazaflavin-dependent oxidoreductase (nitroreductase family)
LPASIPEVRTPGNLWYGLPHARHVCSHEIANRCRDHDNETVRGEATLDKVKDKHKDKDAATFKDFNNQLIGEFRDNEGKVGGMFAGAPLLLLTTTGAKSGKSHVVPLAYTIDDGHYVVIASKGGASSHPDWYYNLRANPEVTVEFGTESFPARASIPEGAERQRLFDQMAEQMPNFAVYQRNTTRQLPVIVLDRLG